MQREVDAAIVAVAAGQELRFSRAQALAAGASPSLIDRRRRSGAWLDLGNGVYAFPWAPDTLRGDLWRAVLAIGDPVVVSHEAAARLHGMRGAGSRPVVVTRPHSSFTGIAGVTVHQISDSVPAFWTTIDGLPVTTPARTLVDGAASWHPSRLRLVTEDAVIRRLTSLAEVAAALGAVARPGKPGVRKLLRLLAILGDDGRVPPESELERLLFGVLDAGGEPPPQRQVPLPGRQAIRGLVDAAYVAERLIVEGDGRTWHGRYQAMARDRERDAEAARAGWQTLRFVIEHLTTAPGWVVETVRETRLARQALLAGSRHA